MGHLKPRSATVLIYQGDDLERISELRRTAEVAKRKAQAKLDTATAVAEVTARRNGDEIGTVAAQEEYDAAVTPSQEAYNAFVEVAAERALEVQLHSIGKLRFKKLMDEHPPRMVEAPSVDDDDAPADAPDEVMHDEDGHPFYVNTETFPWALLSYIDEDNSEIRTIAEPQFKDRKECMGFLEDELADGEFGGLWVKAWSLNRAGGADPKATLYSTASLSSATP